MALEDTQHWPMAIVTYKYIRFYEFALKKIKKYIYAGLGYQLDYHWDITFNRSSTCTK